MTYYLISAVLIGVLVLTTWRVARMHREIRALRAHNREFERSLAEATLALAKIGRAIDDICGEGGRVLVDLGMRIEEGRELATLLEELGSIRELRSLTQVLARVRSAEVEAKAARA